MTTIKLTLSIGDSMSLWIVTFEGGSIFMIQKIFVILRTNSEVKVPKILPSGVLIGFVFSASKRIKRQEIAEW